MRAASYTQLELHRAHTPRALGICDTYMVVNMADLRTAMYAYIYRQLVRMSRSTWTAVGTVNRRGYDDQQIDAICDAPCQTIRSILQPVFVDFDLFVMLRFSQTPRCPDLAILVRVMIASMLAGGGCRGAVVESIGETGVRTSTAWGVVRGQMIMHGGRRELGMWMMILSCNKFVLRTIIKAYISLFGSYY